MRKETKKEWFFTIAELYLGLTLKRRNLLDDFFVLSDDFSVVPLFGRYANEILHTPSIGVGTNTALDATQVHDPVSSYGRKHVFFGLRFGLFQV